MRDWAGIYPDANRGSSAGGQSTSVFVKKYQPPGIGWAACASYRKGWRSMEANQLIVLSFTVLEKLKASCGCAGLRGLPYEQRFSEG
jgi:hypothetical protein